MLDQQLGNLDSANLSESAILDNQICRYPVIYNITKSYFRMGKDAPRSDNSPSQLSICNISHDLNWEMVRKP